MPRRIASFFVPRICASTVHNDRQIDLISIRYLPNLSFSISLPQWPTGLRLTWHSWVCVHERWQSLSILHFTKTVAQRQVFVSVATCHSPVIAKHFDGFKFAPNSCLHNWPIQFVYHISSSCSCIRITCMSTLLSSCPILYLPSCCEKSSPNPRKAGYISSYRCNSGQ